MVCVRPGCGAVMVCFDAPLEKADRSFGMWDSKPSLVLCGPAWCRDFLIQKWYRAAMVTSDT